MKKLKYVDQIEKMSDKQLRERIAYSMKVSLKNKIRPVPYMGGVESVIRYVYPELIARCPMTKIMDLYEVKIEYIPHKFLPELKSLKMYFWNYDQLPISHEHLFARIWKDYSDAIKPKWLKLTLLVAPRGEVTTIIQYEKKFK